MLCIDSHRIADIIGSGPHVTDDTVRWLDGLVRSSRSRVNINDYDPIAASFDHIMGEDFHRVTHRIRKSAAAKVVTAEPL